MIVCVRQYRIKGHMGGRCVDMHGASTCADSFVVDRTAYIRGLQTSKYACVSNSNAGEHPRFLVGQMKVCSPSGRNHVVGKPSCCCSVYAPCTWITMGTGPS